MADGGGGGSNNPSPGAPGADTATSSSSVQRLQTQQESAGGLERSSRGAGLRHSKRSVVRNALNSRPSLAQGRFEDVHGQPNYEATAPTCLEQVHFVNRLFLYNCSRTSESSCTRDGDIGHYQSNFEIPIQNA